MHRLSVARRKRHAVSVLLALAALLMASACATTTPRDGLVPGSAARDGTAEDGLAAEDLGLPDDAGLLEGDETGEAGDLLGADGAGDTGGAGGGGGGAAGGSGESGGGAAGGSGESGGGAAGGSGGGGGGTAGGSGGSGGAAAGGGGAGGGAPAGPAGQQGRGVTADTVKVGFIVIENVDKQADNNGFAAANSGNPRKVVEALVKFVNDNGGFGGKKVDAVIRSTSLNTASAATETANCTGFVQDAKVFAVVPLALIYEDTRACYAKGQTLLVDTSGFPYDKVTYDTLAPYYWSPGYADYTRLGPALVDSLNRRGYFAGGKVGIVTYNSSAYRRVVESVYKPALQRAGAGAPEVFYVDQSSLASTQQGTNSAVVSFRSAGVDRVMFIGASTLTTFFMNRAESVQFRPKYGLTTYDTPAFLQLQTKSNSGFVQRPQLENSVGVGFAPANDVDSAKYPWPSAQEKPCLNALAAAGIRYNTHYDAARSLSQCSSLLFLKAAADKAGPVLNVSTWSKAAEGLGTSFQSPIGIADNASAGRRATAGAYFPLTFDGGCGCFVYSGPQAAFGG